MPETVPTPTPSPCVRLCALNDDEVCVGCGRTLNDIKAWTKMTEPERVACVERAVQNLHRMGRAVGGGWLPKPSA